MGKNLSFNLILNERVQKLLDDFATVMNVHIVFFDRDGQPLKRGRGEECSKNDTRRTQKLDNHTSQI